MADEKQTLQVKNTANDFMGAVEKQITDFQKQGQLQFPANYSVENAVKSAWLVIMQTLDRNKKPALSVCTKTSIYNALLNTVIQGLNPAKQQCYYIVYGNQLTMLRSYFGTAEVTMRVAHLLKPPFAQVIYKGDELDYDIDNGAIHNIRHKQKFENIKDENIIGAYCVLLLPDGSDYCGIMTLEDIHKSWSFGQTKGTSNAHKETPGEMAKKTVISRTCKLFLKTSDDSDILSQSFFHSDDQAEAARVEEEVQDNANKIPLEVEGIEVDPETGEANEGEPDAPEEPEKEAHDKAKSGTQSTLGGPNF